MNRAMVIVKRSEKASDSAAVASGLFKAITWQYAPVADTIALQSPPNEH